MTAYRRGTEGRLNDIMTLLGTTAPALWPFTEATGQVVSGVAPADLVPTKTSATGVNLEAEFSPMLMPCGWYNYAFNPTGVHHLAGLDHANFSFGTGSADVPMSIGAWIRPGGAITSNVIMSKYDSAGTKREWRYWLNASSKLELEIYDESATASWKCTAGTAITLGQWVHAVATYDGTASAPVMALYINGAAVTSSSAMAGTYVAMENTSAPVLIGAGGVTATPLNCFYGRIAAPFVTGAQLTATQVATLYAYMAPMVGLA